MSNSACNGPDMLGKFERPEKKNHFLCYSKNTSFAINRNDTTQTLLF